MDRLLEARGLTKRFGGLVAVSSVDLVVRAGQVHGLIGPNGAGKTTLFNLLSGFVTPDTGSLRFAGQDITRRPIHQRTSLGLVRTFQNIRLFGHLTVLENILIGQHTRARPGLRAIWPVASALDKALRRDADALLDLFGLADQRQRLASDLPYGAQKRVELARALAAHPKMVLLDEPTAGMNESESDAIVQQILAVRDRGVTVVLVEHDMNVVMGTSDVVTVLNFGVKIAEGTPQQVQDDEQVRLAYLGHDEVLEA